MISLILIGIISLIVIAGTTFLFLNKNQQLNQPKKSKILLIVGIVIFVSFIVTTFKHRNISFDVDNQNQFKANLDEVYFKCNAKMEEKYKKRNGVPNQNIDEIYAKNYRSLQVISGNNQHFSYFLEGYQENILYLSEKDGGTSYFLANLANNMCLNQKIPTLYLKLNQKVNTQQQFLQKIGIQTFQNLQNGLCYYSGIQINRQQKHIEYKSKQGTYKTPYLIIDNYEHLLDTLTTTYIYRDPEQTQSTDQQQIKYPTNTRQIRYINKQRLISKIFDLMLKCKTNIILNSQSKVHTQRLYEIWNQQVQMRKINDKYYKDVGFPFEFHIWESFRHYDVYKIVTKMIPGSDYVVGKLLEGNKKEKYNFRELYGLIDKVQEGLKVQKDVKSGNVNIEDKSWRQWTMKLYVAEYFKLGNVYQMVKNSQNKKISYLKNIIPLKQLYRLEQIGLVKIQSGLLTLK